jgi:hypothetical protein
VLVPWRNSEAIAQEVIALVSDDARRRAMCGRAAAYGVGMTWPAVARQYVESFSRARADTRRRHTSFPAQTLSTRPGGVRESDPGHVRAMTDRDAPAHAQYRSS